jgi:dipeptidyl aminopeptidase/acylaminoacyl peptidase
MNKKWSFLLVVLVVSLLMSSCGARSTGVFQDKDYTRMTQIGQYGFTDGSMLGISPDGERLVVWVDGEIKILDADTGKEKQSFECEIRPSSKKALWNRKGDAFVLGDAARTPSEIMLMRVTNIVVYGPEDEEQLTDEDKKYNLTDEDSKLLFSPTWSADSEDILYCFFSNKGSNVVKIDVKEGDESTLFHARREKMPFVRGIELKDGLLLCEYNGTRWGDNDVFLYDVKSEYMTSLDDVVDNGDTQAYYEIKGWSEDRRTVLINKWIQSSSSAGLAIQRCMILTFNSSFKDYSIKTIEYGFRVDEEAASDMGINPLLIDERHGNNRLGYASLLSPGGRYVLTVDRLYEEDGDMLAVSNRSELVLHDLKTGKDHMLYTNQEDEMPLFGVSSALNGNTEGLFMTRDGKLLIWFNDGYRLFKLEP